MKKKLSMLMVALLSIAAFATTMSLTIPNRVIGEAQDEVSPEGGSSNAQVNGTSFWINGTTNAGSGTQISPMTGKGIKVRKATPLVMTVNEGYQINSVTAYAASNDNSKTFQIAKIEVDGVEYVPSGVEMPITCAQKNASEATTIAITGIKATQNIKFTFDGTNSQGIMEFHVNYTQTAVITQEITAVKLNGAEISAEDLATLKSAKSLTIDGSKLNGIGALDVTLSSGATTVTRDIADGNAVYTFSINNGADEFTVKVTNVAKTYTAAGSVVSYVADALSNDNKTLTVDGIAFNYATKPFGYANNTPGVTLGENTYKPIKLSTGEGVSVTFPEGKKATKIIVYGWSTDGSGYMKTFKDGAEGANSIDTNDNKFYATDATGSIYPSVYEYNVENWEALYFECAGGQPFVVMDFVFAGESATKTIYFDPGVWAESEQEASYAAWAWGDGAEGAWYAFDTEQRAFAIPETCANIIFVRYNPEIQFDQLTWNDVWNQTDDITIGNKNMFEITGWKGADGSTYSTYSARTWPPTWYSVIIAEGIQNGSIAVTPNSAEEGTTVTVTATPDEGYVLDAISVTCVNIDQAVQVAEDGTFTMPADHVTVNATFKEPSIVTTKTLYLKPGVWSADNARFAARILDRQNPENNSWADFAPVTDAEGYYQAEIPEDASMVRMFRFDPQTTENSEDAGKFWNRTPLIEDLGTNNLVKITGWGEGFDPYELATYPEQGGGDEPIVSYYVVGNMTKWQIENTFQLLPSKTEEGLYEYYGTFAANDEIKVLDDKGTWYPSGNNYVFAEAGDYVVSFRPAGNIEGWFGGYFNVAKQGGDDPQPTEKYYQKVTSTNDITDGTYLIVYEGDKDHDAVAFDGALTSLDAAKNTVAVAINDGKIAPSDAVDAAIFTIDVTNGTLKSASGKYIGITSNSNGLKQDDNAKTYKNSFTIDDNGNAVIKAVFDESVMTMRYNYASDNLRFRYYKSGQQAVALYKLVGEGGGDTPEPSLVSKVQICGATDAKWENRIDFELNSAAPAQPNVYFNTLDATDYTDDVEFKLVINDEIWRGIGEINLLDNEGLVDVTTNADGSKNFILKNSNLKYKTYNFKALWKGKEDAGSNWELEVFGQDLRSETPQPTEPVFIVVGEPQSIFGGTKDWDTENGTHKMEMIDGKYYCTFTNVEPQEKDIQLKVYNMANGAWFGKTVEGGENIVFNMKETGDFTVVLDVNADFTEGYVWVDGDNVVFPETPDPQPTGKSFTIKFKDNGAGSSDGTAAKTEIADLIADGADYVKATAAEKAYNGKEGYGVKLSSSSANGSMTLTLAQSVKPTKITFKASAWVNGKGVADAASISINDKAAQELTDELAEYAVDYDGETEISEIAIAATKRAYITEVTVFYGDGGDTPTVDTYGIVGDLTGGWEKDLMMTVSPNDANIYTATVEGVEIAELKGYEYKLRANKSWQGYQIPTEGNQIWKPEAVGVYTFTFTANIAESTLTVDAQKTADIEIIANTPETALTVADAIALIGNTDATVLAKEYNKVYVKGTATDIGTVNEKYYSLTYYLTDGENKIQIYSGKYLKGADFDQDKADALKDKVVTVYGNLKLFNGTPEVDMNSIIYSIEGEEPVADTWTVAGSAQALFGTAWDPANTANDMQLVEGLYTWQKTDVAVPANTVVEFKVVKNHSWDEGSYPSQNYKLTITEQGTYTITITFDAEAKAVNAEATKTGGADLPDATIDVVQLLGEWNGWKTIDEAGMPAQPIMTKGEGNVWTGVLDLSKVTADQQFKLVVNKDTWIGSESDMVINAPEGWVEGLTEVDDNNFLLKNATTGYQTYDITATWQASPNAAAGWTLTIAGKDERVEPQPVENDYSVQFVNLQGWETVNAYAYEGDQKHLGEWPGAPMTLINEQASYGGVNYPVYELKFKATAAPEFIVFNNGQGGNGNQTEDLAFENGKRYIVLDMKGEPIATVKEPMPLDYSDKVKIYIGMPMIIWGQPSETETVKFKVGDAIHIRIAKCPGMRSPALQLMSNDGEVELSERLATDITEVPAIVTIPVTGALYERMKDEEHKVRLCGQNVWIDRMTVEEGAYEEAATTTEENTISVWVPESEEGDEITEEKTVEIPATSFVVSDVKEEEVVKIKASTVEPNPIIAKRRALAATDISIMKKGSSDVKLVDDANIRVSEDGLGYEFTVTDELATTLKNEGFEIKNNTAKNIKVKAVEVQKIPVPKYYLVGTMTDWAIKLKNELTPNNEVDGEYMISLDLAADDEIKVVMSTDESTVSTWYPDAPDSNYKITESGNYTIYFRPDGKGDGDWHYGFFYVQLNEGTGIKSVKNAAALKGAQIYTISGQRVDKAQKGLYIVNGRKVVIK